MARALDLPNEPLFVVLDGVDGCGKTTQAARLALTLAELRGPDALAPLHLREPGSTVGGERIRELVLAPDVELGRGTLALLFAAARRETLERLVAPALAEGRDVVVERFHPSTFAYQGRPTGDGQVSDPQVAGEVAPFSDDALLEMLRSWAGSPTPTVEIVLDVAPSVAFERAVARDGGGRDRFEARGLVFQERVAAAMRDYVARVPSAVLVDAAGAEDAVAAQVLDAVIAHASEATRV